MNSGRTLEQLAAELTRQNKSKRDFIAPTEKITMVPQESSVALELNGSRVESFGLRRTAHTQLATHLKVPQQYYDRMLEKSPELLSRNVNHWLHSENEQRLVRTLDGDARAFLSGKYRTIDNYDVAHAALPVMLEGGLEVDVMSSEVTESRMYIKAITKRVTFEVSKGDVVQAGIVLSNSETGQGSVRIEPFIYRLICLNGMIAPTTLRKYHVGRSAEELDSATEVFRDATREQDDKAFFMKMQDVVRAAFDANQLRKVSGQLIESAQQKIEQPIAQVIEVVAKKYQLSEGDSSNILENLISGGIGNTRWGLANAVTACANAEPSYEKATQLERIGGELIYLPQRDWSALTAQAVA